MQDYLAEIEEHARLIAVLLRTRVILEIIGLRQDDAIDIRSKTILLIFQLLSARVGADAEDLLMRLIHWYRTDKLWKESLEVAVQDLVSAKYSLTI